MRRSNEIPRDNCTISARYHALSMFLNILEYEYSMSRSNTMIDMIDWLIDMIGSVSKEPGRRHLRSAARGDLVVPASRTRTFGPRAFAISGPDSWNNIPVALRDTALSFHEFYVKLKTELYRQINWNWTISAFVTVSTVRSFSARWTNFAYLLTYKSNNALTRYVLIVFKFTLLQ